MDAPDFMNTPEMREAEEELRRALTEIFSAFVDPDTIAEIESWDFAEDGKTLVVYCRLEDGRERMWSFCPGYPAAVRDL
jgi:hypothetical protein